MPARKFSRNKIQKNRKTKEKNENSKSEFLIKIDFVISRLKMSYVPDKLPCRKNEKLQIKKTLNNFLKLQQSSGSGLYISGMPGTGKTTCINQVFEDLELNNHPNKKALLVKINAMNLASPEDIFKQILNQLKTTKIRLKTAQETLELIFSRQINNKILSQCNKTIIIFVDEIDCLVNRKQNVLYSLFDWPTRFKNIKIFVIGIANTMDLIEQLKQKINSRLGLHRMVFPPYNTAQLKKIILQRIKGFEVFKEEAVEFCSRKISSLSGDIRQALAICLKALENCKEQISEGQARKINLRHISNAIKSLQNSLISSCVSNLSKNKKFVLCVILLGLRCSVNGNIFLFQLIERCDALNSKFDLVLKDREIFKIVMDLKNQNLINLRENIYKEYVNPKIDVGGLEEDLLLAMESDAVFGEIFIDR